MIWFKNTVFYLWFFSKKSVAYHDLRKNIGLCWWYQIRFICTFPLHQKHNLTNDHCYLLHQKIKKKIKKLVDQSWRIKCFCYIKQAIFIHLPRTFSAWRPRSKPTCFFSSGDRFFAVCGLSVRFRSSLDPTIVSFVVIMRYWKSVRSQKLEVNKI